jgi:tRNA threonylcarbamoyladenosine biosynthesis protein TsaB
VLLAIETSTRTASIALYGGNNLDELVAHRVLEDKEKNGTQLATAMASIAELDLAQVEVYAIGIGPGSFTGLRIGLAFLKGIATVYPRPAIAVSTLELIAAGVFAAHPEAARVLPMMDARRNEVYAALFASSDGAAVLDPRLPEAAYPVRELDARIASLTGPSAPTGTVLAAGDGVLLPHESPHAWETAARELWTPDARVLGRIAARRWAGREGVNVSNLEPVYHQLSPAEANAMLAEKAAP